MRYQVFAKSFLISLIVLAVSSVVWGKTDDKTALNVAVRALSAKLQKDLAVKEVDLRFSSVNRQDVSERQFIISGDGFANDFPITFDVTVNTDKKITTEVKYNFLENAKQEFETAEADLESDLVQGLLKKLNADYKTQNIVVAPEGFEAITENGKKLYKGTGEVRLGSMVWKKINFEISVNENLKISEVKYKIQ